MGLLAQLKPSALLPIVVLLLILSINTATSLFDGTGDASVDDSLPERCVVQYGKQTSNTDGVVGESLSPQFCMALNEDGFASIECMGAKLENRLYKEWVKNGLSYYYTFTDEATQDDAVGGNGESDYYSIRVVFPSSYRKGDVPDRWAWILLDRESGTVWSSWFLLNEDGASLHGEGPLNYEKADARDIEKLETVGTWTLERDSEGNKITVTEGENRYIVRFDS